MRILDIEQGTPEWFAARAGIPTASNFDKIITYDGKPSKQRQKYLYQLAGERITGRKEETYQNGAMLRGVELEAEARSLYEMLYNVTIEQVGFCLSDKGYGCSPDGLISNNAGIEIKCPMIHIHVEYLLSCNMPTTYWQQVQGNLLITGREHWVFMSYYPGIKPVIMHIPRDETYLELMAKELDAFCKELNEVTERIR